MHIRYFVIKLDVISIRTKAHFNYHIYVSKNVSRYASFVETACLFIICLICSLPYSVVKKNTFQVNQLFQGMCLQALMMLLVMYLVASV